MYSARSVAGLATHRGYDRAVLRLSKNVNGVRFLKRIASRGQNAGIEGPEPTCIRTAAFVDRTLERAQFLFPKVPVELDDLIARTACERDERRQVVVRFRDHRRVTPLDRTLGVRHSWSSDKVDKLPVSPGL